MSRKNYVTIDEVQQITGQAVTDDQISMAEDQIDAYVGRVNSKHLQNDIVGKAQAGTDDTITVAASALNSYYEGSLVGKSIEIIGGTGQGQRRSIKSHAGDVVTTDSNWGTAPDNTSVYHIFQPGKFPRQNDVMTLDGVTYPGIPEAVKVATAWQILWMTNVDDTDSEVMQSENIGGYSYSRGAKIGSARLIAPKARVALRGFVNRVGQFS